jgi:hypothetical protein
MNQGRDGIDPNLQDYWCILYANLAQRRDFLFFKYLFISQILQALVYCGFLGVYFIYDRILYPPLKEGKHRVIPKKWIMTLRYAYAFFALVNTWFALFALNGWRNLERKLFSTGDQDRDWSYGQLLSLFIWLPVFTTFAQISARQYKKGGYVYSTSYFTNN